MIRVDSRMYHQVPKSTLHESNRIPSKMMVLLRGITVETVPRGEITLAFHYSISIFSQCRFLLLVNRVSQELVRRHLQTYEAKFKRF